MRKALGDGRLRRVVGGLRGIEPVLRDGVRLAQTTRAGEVRVRLVRRSLRPAESCPGDVHLCLGAARLHGRAGYLCLSRREAALGIGDDQLDLMLGCLGLGLRGLDFSLRLVDSRHEVRVVEVEQDFTAFHALVFSDVQAAHRAGNPWGERDDVGIHLGVVGALPS